MLCKMSCHGPQSELLRREVAEQDITSVGYSEIDFRDLPPVKVVTEARLDEAFKKDSSGEVAEVWSIPQPSLGHSSTVSETGFVGTSSDDEVAPPADVSANGKRYGYDLLQSGVFRNFKLGGQP